ncbi:MAG: DUF3007 family protein [Hydrococcus sp. C42_A2020_068]|uniref:DUF3007 family protein n=1 Tax=Pleurocapsa sp. PCC 7327 TaxID=118163 RepID=UPI00029FB9E1|nr:DUF3007 family protein [Pleurocapsa sp. PCC 7327]AFY78572.1 Protein of unknown function (DUF3007) [Pleurocapsa sp. PCC 7327]MBF2020274.1 DUF3007 family protein [Hydrococcus sp. C42_A2020_068]
MRRIDVIGIGIGIFAAGGVIYLFLQAFGLDSLSAGVWSQAILVAGLVGWTLTYLFRVLTKNMTYNQQRRDYEDAILQKRLDEMAPEELEKLFSEVEQEKQTKQTKTQKKA